VLERGSVGGFFIAATTVTMRQNEYVSSFACLIKVSLREHHAFMPIYARILSALYMEGKVYTLSIVILMLL
jgi:hypothetical protein